MLRQSIIDVLLTQIDPSVIDAKTAQDFGLINEKTNRPFFWGQVLDNKGNPMDSWRPAANFADFLLRDRVFDDGRFRVSITMVETRKEIAGGKYVKYASNMLKRIHAIHSNIFKYLLCVFFFIFVFHVYK